MSTSFGIIINKVDGNFFSNQYKTLKNWGEKNSVKLLFFTGEALNSPIHKDKIENYSYSLIDTKELDGLIIFAGSLGSYTSEVELDTFISQYKNIPIVCVNTNKYNYICIYTNPENSIKELINHLSGTHNYTDFAIVTGSNLNFDSNNRLSLFLKYLQEKDIFISSNNIFTGDFSPESGKSAAKHFIKTGLPQVIICLNDDMALSMISEFQTNNINIPEDVAVTGFDGFSFTDLCHPSLTTIEQPLESMTIKAAEKLLKHNKINTNEKIPVKCNLKIRESCGCIDNIEKNINSYIDTDSSNILKEQFNLIAKAINNNMQDNELHKTFINQLKSENINRDLVEKLYYMNYKAAGKLEYNKTYHFFMYHWILKSISSSIYSKTDLHDIFTELLKGLPKLGINKFNLYLFDNFLNFSNKKINQKDKLKLYLSYKPNESKIYTDENATYNFGNIYKEEFSSIISTLSWKEQITGVIQIGLSKNPDIRYEHIKEIITNALHISITNKQLEIALIKEEKLNQKLKEISIRDEMTGLFNRRGFFELSKNLLNRSNYNKRFVLLFIDMDGLKKINDNFGHESGDFAIIQLAKCINKSFREYDIVARLGGDEFTALVKTDLENYGEDITNRITEELVSINNIIKKEYIISASIGFISFINNNSINLNKLLNEADKNLYSVKNSKHNL